MAQEFVTWRFRSWALIPSQDHWSNWMHCKRQTMLDTIGTLRRVNEDSACMLSPNKQYHEVIDEAEAIDYDRYGRWNWTPKTGWKWQSAEDGTPHGKGERPYHNKQNHMSTRQAMEEMFAELDEMHDADK